jgi:acetyl-CoA synthetase
MRDGFLRSLRDGNFEEHWKAFRELDEKRHADDPPVAAWAPNEVEVARSNLGRFMRRHGFDDYADLHAWSVAEREAFWEKTLGELGTVFDTPPERILDPDSDVRDPAWCPGAKLNCADSCFLAPPEQPALVAGREGTTELQVTTYGELDRLANRVASGLVRRGFEPGDAVALYIPMNRECIAAYLGVVRAGCTVVSIPDDADPEELKVRLRLGAAKAVVTTTVFKRGGKELPFLANLRKVSDLPAIVVGGEGDEAWDAFLGDDGFESVVAGPRAVTNILFSSGTTGTPKVIPWTQLTPLKCAMDGHFHHDIRETDVVAWPTSIGWMMGPWLIYAALMNRATIALYEGTPVGVEFCRFVEDARVTILGLVPALVKRWRELGSTDSADWSRLRLFSSTGEPSSQNDYLWLMSRAGYRAPVIEYCGGTEIGGGYVTGTVVQPASPATFTTPALGLDFVVYDEENRPVAPGESGEMYLIPPSIGLSQELGNPDRDHGEEYFAGCPAGPNGEVLRRHGDQVGVVAGGYFTARGRTDDTTNVNGKKISLLPIDLKVNEHKDVAESATIGAQVGGEGAEQLVVYVVPARELKPAEEAALKDELIGHVRAWKKAFRIHDVVFVPELPRTASGKVMRRKLRQEYQSS